MRRGGEIGQRDGTAGEVAPGFRQPADIGQVFAQAGIAEAQRAGVGRTAAGDAAEVFLPVQPVRDLAGEFFIEPGDQAADLHPLVARLAEQGDVGVGFFEEFADHPGAGDD